MLKAGLALFFAVGALASLALWRSGSDPDRQSRAVSWTPTPGIETIEVATVPGDPVETEEGPIDTFERRRRMERSVVIARATTKSDLATAGGWMRSLAVHHALPAVAGPEAERARLASTLLEATNPVARQNVIFLAVLTLPTEVSHPWLFNLMRGGLGGDAEDALVALAFDGDAHARAAFAQLATEPSRAPVRRLLDYFDNHEELGQTGTEEAREVLRSYRAIEVLDREPYFKYTFYATKHREWVPHPTLGPCRPRFWEDTEKRVQSLDPTALDLDRELLSSWVARYPFHPGSDDIAWRLGRVESLNGVHFAAARWYSRAATMPDQDMCAAAVEDLVTTCELELSPDELDRLAHEQGKMTPNRVLVQYIRLRRLAAERGFDVAILYAASLGRDEPHSVLGYSWNHRYAAPVPKGLDSGLLPAHHDDPLRMTVGAPPFVRSEGTAPPAKLHGWLYDQCDDDDERRLDPWRERLEIEEAPLMQQFRAWDTIATLEMRAARATGDARADLLYKQAAVLYHDPRAIFPAYAEMFCFRWVIRDDGNLGPFVRTSYPLVRAIRAFERIECEHPTYAGIDKVLFSRGLAWAKLLGYKCEARELDEGVRRGTEHLKWDEASRLRDSLKIREAVAALERCTTLCPWSPLADDAWRAVLYWRRTRPEVFQ